MRTTKLFYLALFYASFNANAQLVENNGATGAGINNGAVISAVTDYGENAYFGFEAGISSNPKTQFGKNTFIGHQSGNSNSIGMLNTFVGRQSGYGNTTGNSNVFIGANAGLSNMGGSNNIFIGSDAGATNYLGSGNIFIGHQSGLPFAESNKLCIANSSTSNPLIFGDFSSNKIGIGGVTVFPVTSGTVSLSAYSLFVNGGILTEEVRIALQTAWPDYVFKSDYKLPSLYELEQFINANSHLPNVPSANEVAENGIELGYIAKIQQEKIEELTLYVIEQNKQLDQYKGELDQNKKELEELKTLVNTLLQKR